MKPQTFRAKLLVTAVIAGIALSGCVDREAEAKRARQEAEAKARAEAARKEMDKLPKVFQTPDYFKKNEPKQKQEDPKEPNKAP